MQMGCSASRVDNEEVVLMCKERKRFIKQAVDQRYAMAAAHDDYISALCSIEYALKNLAEGEINFLKFIPGAESPTLKKSQSSSEDVAMPKKSSSTSSLHLHSDSHSQQSHSHSHSHSHSASPAESPSSSPLNLHEGEYSQPYESPNPTLVHYLRSNSTPARSYEERPNSPERVQWNSYPNANNQYGMDSLFGNFMAPLPTTSAPPPGPSYSPNHPPPPPSPPKNSAWDIFNPFNYDMDNSYMYYTRSRLSPGSEGSSRDSKHIREEEGIPDLEEDDQGHDGKKKVQADKKTAEKGQTSGIRSPDAAVENSSSSVPQRNPEETIEEKVSSRATEGRDAAKAEGKSPDSTTDKGVVENGEVNEENLALDVRSRNVLEVIQDIEMEFQRAYESGKEVAKIMETNRVPYRPRFNIFKALSARVLNAITLSSKRGRSLRQKNIIKEYDTEEDSGSLLSTLDKIYAWEKKLYEEVKAGERIRIEYEKKFKQLKLHDEKRVDPQLLDATKAAVKGLQSRIKVAVQVVDRVSNTIHKLRDEELQPQIAELIQGFIKMWQVMLDCHQKQKKMISEVKSLTHVAANGMSESHQKATMLLENELRNWHICFSKWIGSQRGYVQALNGWLLKCIDQEPEVTADGTAPFSPRRVGAPPIFIVCNDWSQAFDSMPIEDVAIAMQYFAEAIKEVWEHQGEEQQQKRKADLLAKDLKQRLESLQTMENRLHEPQPSDKKLESDTGQASSVLTGEKISVDSFRKHVEQEKSRHHEVMQETHNLELRTLQMGLKKVFDAMTDFATVSLKTYVELSAHCRREDFSHMNGEM